MLSPTTYVSMNDPSFFLTADTICDIGTLRILIDDYFTYIHPVIPLPHEPTFRAAFARRDDRIDRGFLGQIAAMIEVLAASFPRRPMQIFTVPEGRRSYPNAGALIEKCHDVFNYTRGTDFMDRDPNLTDALCSYLAGLSAGYTFSMARQRRYLAECIVILRTLGFHQPEAPSSTSHAKPIDHIFQQSGRRLFWLCFVGTMSMRQLGGYDSDILIPPTAYTETLPPLPLEVDDEYIYPAIILHQPTGITSRLTGFNINVRIFRAFHRLTALEMLFGKDTVYDWNRQRRSIRSALTDVKQITNVVPRELQLYLSNDHDGWPLDSVGGLDRSASYTSRATAGSQYQNFSYDGSTDPKLAIQFEIQKANIYATQLATRSYLVEKFWNLCEIHDRDAGSPAFSTAGISTLSSPPFVGSPTESRDREGEVTRDEIDPTDTGEQIMAVEREAIVRDMAMLLKNINRLNMEPNGISICNKIRQVASTLLSQDRCRMSRMPHLDPESVTNYLLGFCEILTKLERLGSGHAGTGGAQGTGTEYTQNVGNVVESSGAPGGRMTAQEIEDEQLVQWASLHEHQERFVRMNGFLSNF